MANILHVDVPYQFDVTNIGPVINTLISKINQVAKEQMASISLREYSNIDLAKVTEIFNIIAQGQYDLCVQIGVPTELAPTKYQHLDYNGIISAMGYLGDSINNIIDATQDLMQSEPYKGWRNEGNI